MHHAWPSRRRGPGRYQATASTVLHVLQAGIDTTASPHQELQGAPESMQNDKVWEELWQKV
jgi:hypothetical protein